MIDPEQQKQVDNYIRQLEMQNQDLEAQQHETARGVNSIFQTADNENIIQWQLDLAEQLDNIGHSLRGHVIGVDEETGGSCWKDPEDRADVLFTEYGVQEFLRYLLQYLNKNTILSNYDEETINLKVYDAGYILGDLVFTRYEKFFHTSSREDILIEFPELNNEPREIRERVIRGLQHDEIKEKMKHFETAIKPLIDAIHSSYLRALHGGERESLRSARILTQTESPMSMGNPMQQMIPQKKFHLLNPTTWF